MTYDVDDAVLALASPAVSGRDLSYEVLRVMPVQGVAVSTLGDLLGSETVSASDPVAERLDELQFDLGEGPCWDALASGSPVLHPVLGADARAIWPAFGAAIAGEGLGGLFAFPLGVGPFRLGAIDLYCLEPCTLSVRQVGHGSALAQAVSRAVLRRALEPVLHQGPYSRRALHQATGMVLVQLDVPVDDARLVIQAHAFATGRDVLEVAQDVVRGDIRFRKEHGEIEEER